MRALRSIGLIAAAGLLSLLPAAAQGQNPPTDKKQEESLADAARRLRAQRQSTAQVKRVWTNDNLSSGLASTAADEADGAGAGLAAGGDAGASGSTSDEEEAERAEAEKAVKEEKARLEQLKSDLTLLERDYDLARQQFYSNPSYANDTAGQGRLNAQQSQIDAKKTDIAISEAKVTELEQKLEEVNQRLGPKPPAPLTPEQQQSQWGERLRPLQAELAQVESQIQSLRGQISSTPGISPGAGNDYTRDQIAALEAKRDDLRRRITEIQDEARRTGAPSAWTRPPQ